MWLASRTSLFTYFCILFFKRKNLETDDTKKRIRKTKEEILKKVKESIMIKQIVNEDIEKTTESVKSSEEAVEAVSNMGKIIKSKKCNILWLAYKVKYLKNSRWMITLWIWLKKLGLVNH